MGQKNKTKNKQNNTKKKKNSEEKMSISKIIINKI